MATHFLHIPKTGGTAIKTALRPVAAELGLTLHDHPTRLEHLPAGARFFFFVRDPVARFVSAFYSRRRKGLPHYLGEWGEAERAAFERYPTPASLASELALARPEAIAAMRGIGHVRRPLIHWLDRARLEARWADLLMVGFHDSFAADFERLKHLLNVPAELRLPDDEASSHRNPAALDKALTPKGRNAILAWYASDVALLSWLRRRLSR